MRSFIIKTTYILALVFLAQYAVGIVLHNHRNNLLEETYFPIKRWNDFYAQPENSIDLLFLGSSHCYRSFIPNVFDSTLNINSFNLGSSSQSISTSYYVLKEALKSQTPDMVIFEIYHGTLLQENTFIDVLHNFPQMQSSVKYQMLSTLKIEDAISLAIFPLRQVSINKDQLILNEKQYPDTNSIQYSLYDHKGYVSTHAKNSFHFSYTPLKHPIQFSKINKIQLKHLEKTISLCNEKNIKLIVVTQPLHPDYWAQISGCDVYKELENELTQQNVPYYNFNNIAPLPDSVYYDNTHILNEGAIMFSKNVVKLIKNQNLLR